MAGWLTVYFFLFKKSTVLFKFKNGVTAAHKENFVSELKKLKNLSCVQDQKLVVGGPSVTDPIERSKGYEFALLSFHSSRAALEEYQASPEHHRYVQVLYPGEIGNRGCDCCYLLLILIRKKME